MMVDFEYPQGATPLDPNEIRGLTPHAHHYARRAGPLGAGQYQRVIGVA